MIASLFAMYRPRFATTLVYMLQSTEYQAGPYLAWFWRTQHFDRVMYRRTLDPTKTARLLRLAVLAGMALEVAVGVALILVWWLAGVAGAEYFGLALIIAYPVIWAHLVVVPLLLGRWFIVLPREQRLKAGAKQIFANHPGVKIAVAGSYGKTSMKELLLTVLSEGKKVAATPANKNVASSHAQFAANLDGDEDILIIEYGEGKPGDVPAFAATTQPTHGIITGLAPAHLDQYKTLERAAQDILSLAEYLDQKQVYINDDSPSLHEYTAKLTQLARYSHQGALGWKVSKVQVKPDGTSFSLSKGKRELKLHSGLLGQHQLGPLSLAVALALELGLSEKQVVSGVAQTQPFEHRMQSRQLGGAWIIDDTYNGNLEGVRAGTQLLANLSAKRKLYVTPGLVDQGKQTKVVHEQVGELIAQAKPDIVVLMQNSVTKHIQKGLDTGHYQGEVRVEADPLAFYQNLEHFVAAGDVVLMQNDWTDNYA